jgi:hypothetical protein
LVSCAHLGLGGGLDLSGLCHSLDSRLGLGLLLGLRGGLGLGLHLGLRSRLGLGLHLGLRSRLGLRLLLRLRGGLGLRLGHSLDGGRCSITNGLGDLDALAGVAGRHIHVHSWHGDGLVDADDACTQGKATAVLFVHVAAGTNCWKHCIERQLLRHNNM